MDNSPVIFFDGVCNLCNSTVDFIIRHDTQHHFKFAALQSDVATRLLPDSTRELDTVVLWENGIAYAYSEAALRIAAKLFPFGNVFLGFLIVPKFLRDGIYRWIASNRYRWFGKANSCRLPTPEEQSRFL